MFVQTGSITRAFRAARATGVAVALAAGGSIGAGAAGQSAAEALTSGTWQSAPGYAGLFAPAAQAASYQFFTNPRGLDQILEDILREPATVRAPGGWAARSLLPFDAFGQSGNYDRTKLARLYGAQRAMVARGPRQAAGVVVESWTLVSPYPDLGLTRLEAGTLLIVLRLP